MFAHDTYASCAVEIQKNGSWAAPFCRIFSAVASEATDESQQEREIRLQYVGLPVLV